MKKTDGKITNVEKDKETEEHLFTYSEQEKQENQINKENAKAVFSPKFIPFYPSIKKEYELTEVQTLLFGFIDFYVSNNSNRFYFINEQIAEILDCSERTITRSIKTLEEKGLIKTNRKIMAGGGQIRFIKPTRQNVQVRLDKLASQTRQNVSTNNNKIKDNKINKRKINKKKSKKKSSKRKYSSIHSLSEKEFEEISEKYDVPLAFVRSKYDDMINWHESTGKRRKNWYATLRNFVKKDAIEIKQKQKNKSKIKFIPDD